MLSLSGKASVVVTDISPDSSKSVASSTAPSWFAIDFNKDGIEDYNFNWSFGRYGGTLFCHGPAGNEISVTGAKSVSNYDIITVTDSGETIDNTLTWVDAAKPGSLITGDGEIGFEDEGERFIAVRFKIGTAVHYGWINISFSSITLNVLSYAYESVAGTSIVTPVDRPVANFSSSSITADSKTTVNFFDLSTKHPTSWEWTFTPATVTFMGGTGPTSKDPQVKFNADGKYTVKLKVTDASGSDSITRTDYITILTAPTVDFTASTVSTDTKTTVTFTESCTSTPTAWEWSFTPATMTYMAGTGPTSKNPQVKFNVAGKYTVKLKASNAAGTDSSVKTNYVTVTDTPTSINNYGMTNPAVTIYPNPASQFFIIENQAGEGTMTILDLNGRVEFSRQLTGKKTELDIRQLPKGYHMLRIATPDGVQNTKLIIE